MKSIKWILFLLCCIFYTTTVFGAEMTAEKFFDFNNSEKTTRLEIREKTTGNIVNVTQQEEIEKFYNILKNTEFSKIMTYDAYVRENKITADYSIICYQNDTMLKQFYVTQEKIYNEEWVFTPENTPFNMYYFAKYMMLTKDNYKQSFTEKDFNQNSIFWKDSPIIFQKNQPYWKEGVGVLAEFETLNAVLKANAVYDVSTQTITIKDTKASLFGEIQNGTVYIAVQPFAELLSYDTVWDDTLKILSIKEKKNYNEEYEKAYGKPKMYGTINTVFENNISFQRFLNIDMQKPISKIVIQNEKTNHITVISEEEELQKAKNALNATTVYEMTNLKNQKEAGLLRYKIIFYQNDVPVKEIYVTSQNAMKDTTYYVQCSSKFFDWFYKISETDYVKTILSM